jgi:hypothetical protein
VCGTLTLPPHQRVSDHLAHRPGFIVLRDVELGPARQRAPLAFVNASALVAVAELRADAAEALPTADAQPRPARDPTVAAAIA